MSLLTPKRTKLQILSDRMDRAINHVEHAGQRLELAQTWLAYRLELEIEQRLEITVAGPFSVTDAFDNAARHNTML